MTATLHLPYPSSPAWPDALSHKIWTGQPHAEAVPSPGNGMLLGHQWEARTIAQHGYNAGWHDALDLVTAVAVCLAESQGYDQAIHVNLDGTQDRGAWQLNSIHKDITDFVAYDLIAATDEAFKLWHARGGFGDWAAFTTGVYLHDSYLGRAARGVGNFLAETMLGLPVPDHADGTPYVHHIVSPALNFEWRVAGCLAHVNLASAAIGRQAAPKAKVDATQLELGKARIAAKASLPST